MERKDRRNERGGWLGTEGMSKPLQYCPQHYRQYPRRGGESEGERKRVGRKSEREGGNVSGDGGRQNKEESDERER